jgi:hypothetical protein
MKIICDDRVGVICGLYICEFIVHAVTELSLHSKREALRLSGQSIAVCNDV